MRLFGISSSGELTEYVRTDFGQEHREEVLENWLEKNPDGVVEDSKLLIIGRQVQTNLGGAIDLLAVDRNGDLAVIELKRERTPRDTIAQALEYASYGAQLTYEQLEQVARHYHDDEAMSLAEAHREYFALPAGEAVSFNKEQRIVVVGETVTREIRQTGAYLNANGLRVTCLEFSFFETDDGKRLLSGDPVVSSSAPATASVASGSRSKTTREEFLASLDENGVAAFSKVLGLADEKSLPVHWGVKGFSMNVDFDGTHLKFCYGYPPQSVYGQSVYTRVFDSHFLTRINSAGEIAQRLSQEAKATGLFEAAGNELKCPISRMLSHDELDALLSWIGSAAAIIGKHGLKKQQREAGE